MENQNQATNQVLKTDLKLSEADPKAKAEKIKAYDQMLKKLYKTGDLTQLKALATEFNAFDPEKKRGQVWLLKAEKQEKKLQDKKEGKGFFSRLFGLSHKKDADIKTINPIASSASALPDLNLHQPVTPGVKISGSPEPSVPMAVPVSKPTTGLATTSSVTPLAVPAQPLKSVSPSLSTPVSSVGSPDVKISPSVVSGPVAPKIEMITPVPVTAEVKGNTFTKIFGKNKSQDTKSIMDRIVAKVDRKGEPKANAQPFAPVILTVKEKKPFNLLGFSKLLMNFTAVFIFMTGAFLYVDFLDDQNTVMGFVGFQDNTGSRLHKAADEVAKKKKEEATLTKEIAVYKSGYADASLKTVDGIIAKRINWPDVFRKINEVTNSVYELNDFFKYIEYSNYSFDAEKGTIRISGTLSDPQGRNLTKLVELEEAFEYYPKDKNNAEDPAKPYFNGFKELTSFTKSLNQTTGRYVSNFQLSFSLNQ